MATEELNGRLALTGVISSHCQSYRPKPIINLRAPYTGQFSKHSMDTSGKV